MSGLFVKLDDPRYHVSRQTRMSSTVSIDKCAESNSRARVKGSKVWSAIQQNPADKVDAVLCFLPFLEQKRVIEVNKRPQ